MNTRAMARETMYRAGNAVTDAIQNVDAVIETAVDILVNAWDNGGRVLAIGPFADYLQTKAQRHPAARYWPVLTTPACWTDEQAIETLGLPSDVLVGYLGATPTRGQVAAVMAARMRGLRTILMVGDRPAVCGGDVQLLTATHADREAELQLLYTHILLDGVRAQLTEK